MRVRLSDTVEPSVLRREMDLTVETPDPVVPQRPGRPLADGDAESRDLARTSKATQSSQGGSFLRDSTGLCYRTSGEEKGSEPLSQTETQGTGPFLVSPLPSLLLRWGGRDVPDLRPEGVNSGLKG